MLTNYQRALDDKRVREQVTPFFRMSQNCSPTAIVLSLQETNVCKISFEDSGIPSLDSGIHLKRLQLDLRDLKKTSSEDIVAFAVEFLDARISDLDVGEAEEGDEPNIETQTDTEGDSSQDSADGEDDTTEEDPVEIGQSMLRSLREKLDSPELLSEEMIDSLREMLMPALVIDGQHRLFGASGVEEDVPLLVCSMIKPDWKEQVFQFIVVNDKAAGIPKPFITSLAGMSLTGPELDELRNRLSQAGIQLWEVEVMQRLGYDSASPFCNLIEFKVAGSQSQGLGYQTMKRVGKAWYSPKSAGLYKLMQALYVKPGDKCPARKVLRERWQSLEDWFQFLCLFWDAYKNKFEKTSVWEVHSNLLTAVVIEMLQADFMKVLDAQSKVLWNVSTLDDTKRIEEMTGRIREFVQEHVGYFHTKHFDREWKRKSLNQKDGKKDLADLFRLIREGEPVNSHVIYTGKTG